MAFRTKDGTWRALMRVNGRRISRNFPIKAMAEDWESRVKRSELDPQERRAPAPTFDEFFEEWKSKVGAIELADSTLKQASTLAKKFIAPRWGRLPLDSVSRDDCLDFRAELARTAAPAYANNVIALAKRLFLIATQWRRIPENPWVGVKRLPVKEQAFAYWTPTERDRFLTFARSIDPAFAELATIAAHTGLRWGELHALERRHLDFDQRRIMVTANFRPMTGTRVETTKTGKVGFVPMNEAALAVLRSRTLAAMDAPVFDPAVLRAARYRMEKVAKAAGVKPIRFHDLRHTFASCLALAGVDLLSIQKLMRHASVAMTQRYAHLTQEHLGLAAERLCAKPAGTDLAPIRESGREKLPKVVNDSHG